MNCPLPPPDSFPERARLDEVHAQYAAWKENLFQARLAFVRTVFLYTLAPPPITLHGSSHPFFEFRTVYPVHLGPAAPRVFSWAGEAPYTKPEVYETHAPPFICKLEAHSHGVTLGVRANKGILDAVRVAGLEKRLGELLRVQEAAAVEALATARQNGQARVDAEARQQRENIQRHERALAEARNLITQAEGRNHDLRVPSLEL